MMVYLQRRADSDTPRLQGGCCGILALYRALCPLCPFMACHPTFPLLSYTSTYWIHRTHTRTHRGCHAKGHTRQCFLLSPSTCLLLLYPPSFYTNPAISLCHCACICSRAGQTIFGSLFTFLSRSSSSPYTITPLHCSSPTCQTLLVHYLPHICLLSPTILCAVDKACCTHGHSA